MEMGARTLGASIPLAGHAGHPCHLDMHATRQSATAHRGAGNRGGEPSGPDAAPAYPAVARSDDRFPKAACVVQAVPGPGKNVVSSV